MKIWTVYYLALIALLAAAQFLPSLSIPAGIFLVGASFYIARELIKTKKEDLEESKKIAIELGLKEDAVIYGYAASVAIVYTFPTALATATLMTTGHPEWIYSAAASIITLIPIFYKPD